MLMITSFVSTMYFPLLNEQLIQIYTICFSLYFAQYT